MLPSRSRYSHFAHCVIALTLASCTGVQDEDGSHDLDFRMAPPPPGAGPGPFPPPPPPHGGPITVQERLDACAQDPRVVASLVSVEVCAGADLFFRETFDGNGRNCGSCHPVDNNFTIDADFIATLPPHDPLFVAEQDPGLATLERPQLMRDFGLILENVDGADDLAAKFTMRSVPHTLSMATSLTPDAGDGTTQPPNERTGWSGDGAPNNGELRDFLSGAVFQHYPADLDRIPGVSFREPNDDELDLTLAYQLSLGRTNELDLGIVALNDLDAAEGQAVFIDNARGRCNGCHQNAGANFSVTAANRNFDTGVEQLRLAVLDAQGIPLDGGFGGQGLAAPNFDSDGDGVDDAFGNGTFNTTPLVEAADTGPFFHTNAFDTVEDAVAFYGTDTFNNSPSGLLLQGIFGGPIALSDAEVQQVGRFLRVVNAGFNVDMARQRLEAAVTLVTQFGPNHTKIQRKLMKLAAVELEDALDVLDGATSPLHGPTQGLLHQALMDIAKGRTTPHPPQRHAKILQALAKLDDARDDFGTNLDFDLGEGNLMF
ncbi:MAG: hypothetical protein K0V04_36320 [Deltaproteobacteria bacterium]|nr:hypothetical protein [Deltaproteobacteria bacterium]